MKDLFYMEVYHVGYCFSMDVTRPSPWQLNTTINSFQLVPDNVRMDDDQLWGFLPSDTRDSTVTIRGYYDTNCQSLNTVIPSAIAEVLMKSGSQYPSWSYLASYYLSPVYQSHDFSPTFPKPSKTVYVFEQCVDNACNFPFYLNYIYDWKTCEQLGEGTVFNYGCDPSTLNLDIYIYTDKTSCNNGYDNSLQKFPYNALGRPTYYSPLNGSDADHYWGINEVYQSNFCADQTSIDIKLTAAPTIKPTKSPVSKPTFKPTKVPSFAPTSAPTAAGISVGVSKAGWVLIRECSVDEVGNSYTTTVTLYQVLKCFPVQGAWYSGYSRKSFMYIIYTSGTSKGQLERLWYTDSTCSEGGGGSFSSSDRETIVGGSSYFQATFQDIDTVCPDMTTPTNYISWAAHGANQQPTKFVSLSKSDQGRGRIMYSNGDMNCTTPVEVRIDVFRCLTTSTTDPMTQLPIGSSSLMGCIQPMVIADKSYEKSFTCYKNPQAPPARWQTLDPSGASLIPLTASCSPLNGNQLAMLGFDYFLSYTNEFCGYTMTDLTPTAAPSSRPTLTPTHAPFSAFPTLAPESSPNRRPTSRPTTATVNVQISFSIPGMNYFTDALLDPAGTALDPDVGNLINSLVTTAISAGNPNTANLNIGSPVFLQVTAPPTRYPSAKPTQTPTARPTNPTPRPTASPTPKPHARRQLLREESDEPEFSLERRRLVSADLLSIPLSVSMTISGSYADIMAGSDTSAATPAAAIQGILEQYLADTFKNNAIQEAVQVQMKSITQSHLYSVMNSASSLAALTDSIIVYDATPTSAPVPAVAPPSLPPAQTFNTIISVGGISDGPLAGVIIGGLGGFMLIVGGLTAVYLLWRRFRRGKPGQDEEEKEEKVAVPIMERIRALVPSSKMILTFFPENKTADVEDLHRLGLALPITVFYVSVFIACLAYFTASTTTTLVNQKFLSLDSSTADQSCISIPQTVTSSFKGDISGAWEANSTFQANTSIFILQMAGTSITLDTYRNVMATFDLKLEALGQRIAARDFAFGIISWATFRMVDVASRMSLLSNVDSTLIFNGMNPTGSVWSRDGVCLPQPGVSSYRGDASFEQSGTYLRLTFRNATNQVCMNQFRAQSNFQFNPTGTGVLAVDFDARSLFTALAINLNILTVDFLVQVHKNVDQTSDLGAYYIDPFYDTMTPIFCLYETNEKYPKTATGPNGGVCFVPSKSTLFYPALWNVQPSRSSSGGEGPPPFGDYANNVWKKYVERCLCPAAAGILECNTVFLQLVLIYWKDISAVTSLFEFGVALKKRFLTTNPDLGDIELNNYLFQSLPNTRYHEYTVRDGGINATVNVLADSQLLFDGLCPDQGCAAFQFFITSSINDFLGVNSPNLQYGSLSSKTFSLSSAKYGDDDIVLTSEALTVKSIPQITCVDTLYKKEAISNFYKPPTQLVQPYQQCHMTQRAAFMNAIGSSAGSATLYSSLIFSIVVALVVQIVNSSSKKNEAIIPPDEKRRQKIIEESQSMFNIYDMVDRLVEKGHDHDMLNKEEEEVAKTFLDTYRTTITKRRKEVEEMLEEEAQKKEDIERRKRVLLGRKSQLTAAEEQELKNLNSKLGEEPEPEYDFAEGEEEGTSDEEMGESDEEEGGNEYQFVDEEGNPCDREGNPVPPDSEAFNTEAGGGGDKKKKKKKKKKKTVGVMQALNLLTFGLTALAAGPPNPDEAKANKAKSKTKNSSVSMELAPQTGPDCTAPSNTGIDIDPWRVLSLGLVPSSTSADSSPRSIPRRAGYTEQERHEGSSSSSGTSGWEVRGPGVLSSNGSSSHGGSDWEIESDSDDVRPPPRRPA